MFQTQAAMTVDRINSRVSIIRIQGEFTGKVESCLAQAYATAGHHGSSAIILDLARVDYLDSSGIGLLIQLLLQAQAHQQRILGYGLNEHYREILSITRLDRTLGLYPTERAAVTAAQQERACN